MHAVYNVRRSVAYQHACSFPFPGLPAAYVAIVAPASAVAARLQEPWGVLRTPLSLGILTNNDYAQMMAAVPKPPLVRAAGT
eukprot:1158396-Pelagomonas_calceolata.AAC.4